MAKQTQPAAQAAAESIASSVSLAERLYANNWRVMNGYTDEHLAGLCLKAAEAFERAKQAAANPLPAAE